MRPLRVVVLDEDAHDAFEVAAVEDQQSVQAFGADGLDNRSAMAFACGARTGVLMIPALWSTSSKAPLYLLPRSRIKKRTPSSARSRPTLRACWVIQTPVGFGEQPVNRTRRLACAMKKKT
jgi:hypothetical protein